MGMRSATIGGTPTGLRAAETDCVIPEGITVSIRTQDDRTFTSTVYAPKGSGIFGIDGADVDAKYRTLVPQAQLRDQQVEASLQVIHDFRQVKHVSALLNLLQVRTWCLLSAFQVETCHLAGPSV